MSLGKNSIEKGGRRGVCGKGRRRASAAGGIEGGCPIVTNVGGLGERDAAQTSERCGGVALARDHQLETGQFQVQEREWSDPTLALVKAAVGRTAHAAHTPSKTYVNVLPPARRSN